MNNADLIVRTLAGAGITHGFGIPSGNVLPLLDAMRARAMEFVLMAHEGSAGFAADVVGRLTGRPGLCVATMGPGATNLATGVGSAYLDRAPMIAITCNVPTGQLGRRVQMHVDHHALFRPLTKASLPLREGSVGETLEDALRLALSEPMGPVHLDLPEDVALAPAGGEIPAAPEVAPPPPPPPAAIAKAGALIAGARRPIAVIGANARRLADPGLLRRFLEKHGMPFASTTLAKGMVGDDHPLSIGCIERARRQMQRAFLGRADLIVGLGYDTVEVELEEWIGDRRLVQVDMEPVDAAPSVVLAQEVTGDLDAALAGLLDLADGENDWTGAALADHRAEFSSALRPPGPSFSPHQAIDVVRDVFPDDGIVAIDVGAHTHQIAAQWTAPGPGTFLASNGWSSMGFGLPAAIAARIARPNLPVACILGDGCFRMSCGELAAARRSGLGVAVIVLDDDALSLIEVKQRRRGLAIHGTRLANGGDLGAPAHYFGVPVVAVGDADGLAQALSAALAAEGPTVIQARVDPAHYLATVCD